MNQTQTTLLPDGFTFKRFFCFHDESAPDGEFSYTALNPKPIPFMGNKKKPDIVLTVSDGGAIFQWESTLDADEAELQELKAETEKRYPGISPDMMKIVKAKISTVKEYLRVGSGGGFQDLEVKPGEGRRIALTAVEKNEALKAINKSENCLKVIYKYNLIMQTAIRIGITGDVTPILEILVKNKDRTKDACKEKVLGAINRKVLALTTTEVNDILQGIKDSVKAEVLKRTADTVFSILGNLNTDEPEQVGGPFNISFEANKSEPREYPIEAPADISDWIRDSGYSPVDFVKASSETIKEPDRKTSSTPTESISPPEPPGGEAKITLNVGAAFKPGDYQVSAIQLTWGDVENIMKWPDFAGVSLTSASKEDLKLKITYTFGQTFGNYLPFTGKDWLIQPEDIGLIPVTLDGSEPEIRDAKEARGSVQYVPSGGGLKSTRNFYFHDKGKWRDSWYVASLAKDLAGTLNLEWTETTQKNKHEKHLLKAFKEEHLTLE